MTTARWIAEVPVLQVPLDWLSPTQQRIDPAAVVRAYNDPTASWCGDPYPHLVWCGPALCIEDGHHRVIAARMRHHRFIRARVLIPRSTDAVEDQPPAS